MEKEVELQARDYEDKLLGEDIEKPGKEAGDGAERNMSSYSKNPVVIVFFTEARETMLDNKEKFRKRLEDLKEPNAFLIIFSIGNSNAGINDDEYKHEDRFVIIEIPETEDTPETEDHSFIRREIVKDFTRKFRALY